MDADQVPSFAAGAGSAGPATGEYIARRAVDPVYAAGARGVARPLLPDLLGRLVGVLLPASCLGCGRRLGAGKVPLGLCPPCRGRLRPVPPGGEAPSGCDRLLALWCYEQPLEAVVQALKFRRLDYLGEHLGSALAEALGPRLAAADLVVPVPLHWRRRLARGYNQAEAIARPLARALGLPLLPALARVRPTPAQSSLGRRERLANLRRAFRTRAPDRLAGRRVLLVDDVATTGATLEAAAAALRAAGAAAVTAVVAGRTPARRPFSL